MNGIYREDVHERLKELLALNAETERRRQMFRNDADRRSFQLMRNPVDFELAFATLGGFLGGFPPAAVYLNLYLFHTGSMGWFLALFVFANIVTCTAGFYLGALVGKIVRFAETKDWITMSALLILIGATWGAASGFVGGAFLFLIGAFVGGALGALVGALTLPLFAIFHRSLNIAGFIDRRLLFPLASGISLAVAAFILSR